MKSKAYFIVRTALFTLSVIALLLFLIYLVSFIVFSLRISGVWFLPTFGFFGIRTLLGSLPWLLILLVAALIVLLELFAGRISLVYKKPVVYSLFAIIAIVVTVGLVVGFSPLHAKLFHSGLPFIGPLYQGYGTADFHNVHNGRISAITANGFTMETPNGNMLTVITNDAMKQGLKEGDYVLVVGAKTDSTIKATILKKIDQDSNFFLPRRRVTRRPLPTLSI